MAACKCLSNEPTGAVRVYYDVLRDHPGDHEAMVALAELLYEVRVLLTLRDAMRCGVEHMGAALSSVEDLATSVV